MCVCVNNMMRFVYVESDMRLLTSVQNTPYKELWGSCLESAVAQPLACYHKTYSSKLYWPGGGGRGVRREGGGWEVKRMRRENGREERRAGSKEQEQSQPGLPCNTWYKIPSAARA